MESFFPIQMRPLVFPLIMKKSNHSFVIISDKLIIIDEAYADFNSFNCINLVKKFRNLIIVRTFSKSYSLAGLRIGFCLANKSIIKQLLKVKNSFNSYPVDQLSEIAAINAIKDDSYFEEIIKRLKKQGMARKKIY